MLTRWAVVAVSVVVYVVAGRPALARTPTDDVRRHVEEAFRGFIDAEADKDRGAISTEQRRALRRAADRIFDWPEMARGALGKHWAQATPPQRERFARLFAELLERLYLPMLQRDDAVSAAEKLEGSIAYVGETVRGDQATLHLRWKRPGRDILVDCAMRRKAGGWRIHDVAFDGLSVIDNYRAQFDHMIQLSGAPRAHGRSGEPAADRSVRRADVVDETPHG